MTETTRRIVGVALFMPEATADVVSLAAPARHHDLFRKAASLGYSPDAIHASMQGFYTDDGQFVSRRAAVRIAEEAGQIIRRTAPAHGLFSEDVW